MSPCRATPAVPLQRFGVILRDTQALRVHETQIHLGLGLALGLGRREPKPLQCCGLVLRPVAGAVHVVLGHGSLFKAVALLGFRERAGEPSLGGGARKSHENQQRDG